MNVTETAKSETKILALFGGEVAEEMQVDPLKSLLEEGLIEETEKIESHSKRPAMATLGHFPDQSMFVLEAQLQVLKESLSRLKFYTSDIDDLIPRK